MRRGSAQGACGRRSRKLRDHWPVADGWLDDPVRLAPYDPEWPARFAAERSLIADALGDRLAGAIHHVGSTAVPGLAAKPVIDISAEIAEADGALECVDSLAAIGYVLAPWPVQGMSWFCKPQPVARTHQLHLVPAGSARLRNELAFRDALRADPSIRAAYAALKRDLARRYEFDRRAYSDSKSDFIRSILEP
jgi:GrpB-like predicted nucleotidyltransferase (UPF0157 family)